MVGVAGRDERHDFAFARGQLAVSPVCRERTGADAATECSDDAIRGLGDADPDDRARRINGDVLGDVGEEDVRGGESGKALGFGDRAHERELLVALDDRAQCVPDERLGGDDGDLDRLVGWLGFLHGPECGDRH